MSDKLRTFHLEKYEQQYIIYQELPFQKEQIFYSMEVFMKIRKMEISDYDSVYSLWMSCQGMGLNNIDDAEEGIERFLKRNPDTCFVAE